MPSLQDGRGESFFIGKFSDGYDIIPADKAIGLDKFPAVFLVNLLHRLKPLRRMLDIHQAIARIFPNCYIYSHTHHPFPF